MAEVRRNYWRARTGVQRLFRLEYQLLALWAVSAACGQTGPQVWVAPSLQRIGPSDAPGSNSVAQVWAARGESESFQIGVRAPASGLSNVDLQVSDLAGAQGTIPKSNLTLYREHYVYVSKASPDWGGSNRPRGIGWYADGLIPFVDPATGAPLSGATLDATPAAVAASSNQPYWVDIWVPPATPPGSYTGTFTVSSDQGTIGGQIQLTVWNFTLPVKPSLRSSFAFSQTGSQASIQELLRHKLAPLSTSSSYQRSLIDNFGLGSTHLGFWSGADVGNCTMSSAPAVSTLQAAVANQQPDLYLFNFTADEVDQCTSLYPTIKQWGYNLHQAGARNLVTMKPVPDLYDDGSNTGRSAVDDWVLLPLMHSAAGSSVSQVLQKGDEVWSSNTLVQEAYSPKWEIDFTSLDFRVQPGFINQSLGLTGLLYWRIDRWQSDPWNNINTTGQFSTNNYPGEGILVYPGQTVGIQGVAPSLRLKWLRDGVEDFEYIALLKKAGQGDWALQLARQVGPDWTNWTRDANLLESVRRQLGDQLSLLSSQPVPPPAPPPAASNPSPASGATGVTSSPTLIWSASTGATSYDVYFGTSTSPGLATTTTATSYSPGSLTANTTYYWRVVAKNSGGSSSSSTWQFTTAGPSSTAPAPVAVSPASGSGYSQTFQFQYSDVEGASTITGVNMLFNTSLSGVAACWVYVEVATRRVALARDDGANWDPLTLKGGASVRNSHCTLYASKFSIASSGTTLSVTLKLNFQSSFAGQKTVYMRAQDQSGQASNYVAKGSWRVP